MKIKKLLKLNLHYFEGDGAGAAPSGNESGFGETGDKLLAEAAAQNHKGANPKRQQLSFETKPEADPAKKAEAPAPEESAAGTPSEEGAIKTTSSTLEEKRKAYNDLINGEYKEFYTQDTQNIIDRRFKQTKELEAYKDENGPIIDMLMQRYGVQNSADLTKALENDEAYWSEAADAAGMSVSQYMEFQKLQRENRALLSQQEAMMNAQKADQQYAYWTREAQALSEKYPGFDLATEAKNPDFVSMLAANVPMEHAYRTIHFDEIADALVNNAVAATQKQVTDDIRARGSRPQEAGLSSSNGIERKVDVDKLSGKDLRELARRAERGEIITF